MKDFTKWSLTRSGCCERVDGTIHKCRSNHSDTLVIPQVNMLHMFVGR